MHGKIFQISATPISEDYYAMEGDFYDYVNSGVFDYVGEIPNNKRADVVANYFRECGPLKFDIVTEPELHIVYRGGYEECKKQWVDRIRRAALDVAKEPLNRRYGLEIADALNHPLGEYFRFYDDDQLENSDDFLVYTAQKLKPGDKIYIGSVIDFHI